METKRESIFIELINKRLYEVAFVLDYLQVYFDNCCFTFYVLPTVKIEDVEYSSATPGYRDALCSLISDVVMDVDEKEHEYIKLLFESNNVLILSQKDEDLTGPEFGEMCFTNSEQIIIL